MNNIIVYTKNNCPHCLQVKSFLNEKGISFEERNTDQNDEFAKQVWDMGLRAVPVTLIGDVRILGMSKPQLESALAELVQ